jgi:hypothetical protein
MVAVKIYRTWKFVHTSSPLTMNTRIIWDLGNEVWELEEGSEEIRHFEVISRKQINGQEQVTMEEELSLLPECPVPREAISHVVGSEWKITEKEPMEKEVRHNEQPPSQPLKQSLPHSPPLKQRQVRSKPLLQAKAKADANAKAQSKEEQHHLTQPISNKKTKKTEDSSSETYSSAAQDPNQLWSSLSQWIPPTALYQPSLHHQAVLDMSEKTVHIHLSHKQSSYRPQKFLKHRSLHQNIPQGPLFL